MSECDVPLLINGVTWDGSPRIYRLPEDLHTLEYDLHVIPDDYLQRISDWLRSNPPLHQMRHLSFINAAPASCRVMQDFINLCPALDIVCMFYRSSGIIHEPGAVLDLSRIERLDRLCLFIYEFPVNDLIGEEHTLETILRTVQTATSLTGALDIVAHASHFDEVVIHWWFLLSKALCALPGDFVFKLQV
ncbi:hypothetical protein MPER_07906, partial [Moniliophthora perniciosa FA553]